MFGVCPQFNLAYLRVAIFRTVLTLCVYLINKTFAHKIRVSAVVRDSMIVCFYHGCLLPLIVHLLFIHCLEGATEGLYSVD